MDIGNTMKNNTYYEGYEGEPEVIISITETNDHIHFWDGFFDDIFGSPSLDGMGWHGFTRDMNQLEGAFACGGPTVIIDAKEYLEDMLQYTDRTFQFEETAEVLSFLIAFFQDAIAHEHTLSVEYS